MTHKDELSIVLLYLDIDEYYKIKDELSYLFRIIVKM